MSNFSSKKKNKFTSIAIESEILTNIIHLMEQVTDASYESVKDCISTADAAMKSQQYSGAKERKGGYI